MMRRTILSLDKLVIVESPTKVSSFMKYIDEIQREHKGSLGFGSKELKKLDVANQRVRVSATIGHFMTLKEINFGPRGKEGMPSQFTLDWTVQGDRKPKIEDLKKAIKALPKGSEVIIATDPDREGELIGMHAFSLLPKGTSYSRMYVQAITKEGIEEALADRQVMFMDKALASAAETRHTMDRIFGFLGSRFVNTWHVDLRSIGRVQTPSLILLHERALAIKAAEENKCVTYGIQVKLEFAGGKLVRSVPVSPLQSKGKGGARFEKQEDAESFLKSLPFSDGAKPGSPAGVFSVGGKSPYHAIAKKKVMSPDPLTMQTLILEAGKKLHLSSEEVAQHAQKLFGAGLITYPRTDSTRISDDTVEKKIIPFIKKHHGASKVFSASDKQAAKKGKKSKKKGKEKEGNVEDAHEAIHPTNFETIPSDSKVTSQGGFTPKTIGLYEIIHNATVAAFMIPCETETCKVRVEVGDQAKFTLASTRTIEKGWKAVFKSAVEEEKAKKGKAAEEEEEEEDEEEGVQQDDEALKEQLFNQLKCLTPKNFATVENGAVFQVQELGLTEFHTKPPPQYTEGTLIQELKNNGVGRPSTYPSIVKTLVSRKYAETRGTRLVITPFGEDLVFMGKLCFPEVVDIKFTGKFEMELDKVAKGSLSKDTVLSEFYGSFSKMITDSVKRLSQNKRQDVLPFGEATMTARHFSDVLSAFNRYATLYIPKGCGKKMAAAERQLAIPKKKQQEQQKNEETKEETVAAPNTGDPTPNVSGTENL